MEKIEKVIEQFIQKTEITYKAIDGTVFKDEQECLRYENTVEAVLLSRLKDIQINEIPCDSFCESAGEGDYKVVVPTNTRYIETLNQLWKLFGGKNSSKSEFFDNFDLNKVILVGIRWEREEIDWIWFWKLDDVILNTTNQKYKIIKND